ncbi:uncharacterized protein LOC112327817 [Populus trichocarpa]|uniref:uncharacterized protein LOC112327817 n=1 Tax=Populus trichocarpa TaxID=3694 RepID=UPI000D187E0A|nr:uncharacterized protein LOC112327817 [Populus trichocarpa]|eukprot:XP_024458269.1 uncharacterized protein LOC112327817 isoform X3 [Populus trichocarpa]
MARVELLNFSLSIKVGLVGYFSTAHFSVSVIGSGSARGGLSFHPTQCVIIRWTNVSWCLLRFVMEKLVMVVHLRVLKGMAMELQNMHARL